MSWQYNQSILVQSDVAVVYTTEKGNTEKENSDGVLTMAGNPRNCNRAQPF